MALQLEPGSGAVAMLTVPFCTQRYTVRACNGAHSPYNSSNSASAAARGMAGSSQKKDDDAEPACLNGR